MKKVLSLLLVVTMLFSIFSIASSAAVNNNALAAITVTPKEDRDYQKGEEIIFEVSLEVDQEWFGEGVGSGGFVFGYNSAVLEPVSSLPQKKKAGLATAGVVLEGYDFGKDSTFLLDDDNGTYVKNLADTQAMTAGDLAKGWDKAISICMLSSYGMYYGYASSTKIFAFKMKVKEDVAAGDYSVGIAETSLIVDGDYEKTFLDDAYGGIKGSTRGDNWLDPADAPAWDLTDASFTVATAAAGPEVVALGTMARMDDWTKAESTNTFDGGLIGQINNANLTFTDGECNEIETIEVYANGKKMGNAYQVYKVDDTTYQFRAVILGMDKTADTYSTDVEYEFRVTMKGDYAASGVLTATKTVSAETIFNTAYTNYKNA